MASAQQALTPDVLKTLRDSYANDRTDKAIRNAVNANSIKKLAANSAHTADADMDFTYKVQSSGITDQKSSGRCWLFTGTNVLRAQLMARTGMKDFYFSTTYAKLGRRIQLTELTIPAYAREAEDEALQAEILRNLYRMWFSHPAMEGIIYWNLVDGFAACAAQGDMTAGENYYHGGLVRHDFTPKEAYRVIRDLFSRTWHTELTLETDTDELDFKGFYGVYELEIEAGGKTVRREIHLNRDSNSCFHIVI